MAAATIHLTAAWAWPSLFGWGVHSAFAAPVVRLVSWAWAAASDLDSRYLDLFVHTLTLGAMAGVLTVAAAFVLAYAHRYHGDTRRRSACASACSAMRVARVGTGSGRDAVADLVRQPHRRWRGVLTGRDIGLVLRHRDRVADGLLLHAFSRSLMVRSRAA